MTICRVNSALFHALLVFLLLLISRHVCFHLPPNAVWTSTPSSSFILHSITPSISPASLLSCSFFIYVHDTSSGEPGWLWVTPPKLLCRRFFLVFSCLLIPLLFLLRQRCSLRPLFSFSSLFPFSIFPFLLLPITQHSPRHCRALVFPFSICLFFFLLSLFILPTLSSLFAHLFTFHSSCSVLRTDRKSVV